jgi:sugar/nucleoside kinase (ribokinase family)
MVTSSAEDPTLCYKEAITEVKGYPENVSKTVGGGDVFLVASIAGLINGGEYAGSLKSGTAFGAFISGKKGACLHTLVRKATGY